MPTAEFVFIFSRLCVF